MPRPKKSRKVCGLPDCTHFGPLNYQTQWEQPIVMTVDEYETIRLIDLNGYTQEDCAASMKVARTTIQSIYNDARKKLAGSLVYGNRLIIEGGDVQICGGKDINCTSVYCKEKYLEKG